MTTPRDVAFAVLRAVDDVDAYANLLLPQLIARADLSPADAGLATELAYGTLRRRGTYDAILALVSDRDLDRIDPAVLDALRLGAHQVLSTRIASHAAVHETVELVRRSDPRATGFVNAVLRGLTSATAAEWVERAEAAARSDDERLAVRYSHPVWVIRALRRALDAEGRSAELTNLLDADNAAPGVTMIALPGLAEVPPGAERTLASPVGFRLESGSPEHLVAASGGRIRVQDEGSQLAALALSRVHPVRAGERWLDLCAGPGGKSALLAAEARAGNAVFTANEVSPARAGLVRNALAAIPGIITVTTEDGRDVVAPGDHDRILVDAPCTGLGALRRRPEARWRKTPGDVPELASLQRELLTAAVQGLRPGGVLAYVTCSPHLAETRDITAAVTDEFAEELREIDARGVLESISGTPLDFGDVPGLRAQLWPHRHGTDAMSVSLWQRR